MSNMELSNITKRYGKLTVLADVSIVFGPGKIYGIMGENGAGKSTLFRCMTGLESYEGAVSQEPGSLIGYLSDTPYFYPMVTGREFVDFSLRARGLTVGNEAIEELNRQFRLPLQKYPSQYSMGMKKRLMLFILMLQHNDIYILDEPFNGLDLSGCILLKKWMLQMKAEGKLLVLSSHIISSLTDICDEIYYLHRGRIARTFKTETTAEIEAEITRIQSL